MTDREAPRTVLDTLGLSTMDNAMITLKTLWPSTDTIANAKINRGKGTSRL
jgi:hypothetical protein